jgi:hypothetical protein
VLGRVTVLALLHARHAKIAHTRSKELVEQHVACGNVAVHHAFLVQMKHARRAVLGNLDQARQVGHGGEALLAKEHVLETAVGQVLENKTEIG